jgi:2-succinyl-5-enolpyruvyl-6-hydroxy-3-cyclohexene-1-carboxylate synthase
VYALATLEVAWTKARSNRGAAGVDGVSTSAVIRHCLIDTPVAVACERHGRCAVALLADDLNTDPT